MSAAAPHHTRRAERTPVRSLVLACVCLALTAAACTDVGSPAWSGDPNASVRSDGAALEEGRFALAELRVVDPDAPVEVAVLFVEYRAPDAEWAASALDVWLPQPLANGGLDACRLTLDAVDAFAGASPRHDALDGARIELLDAGPVVLARDRRHALDARWVPAIDTSLSGVVYALEEEGVAWQPGAAYHFEGAGAPGIEPFTVTVAAPPSAELLAVAGQPSDALAVVPAGVDALVEWRVAAGVGADADEIVYLDLYDDTRGAAPLLSCAVRDDGAFALPGDALTRIRETLPDAALRLVMRRARGESFAVDGFDWGEAVFTTSDAAFLAVD